MGPVAVQDGAVNHFAEVAFGYKDPASLTVFPDACLCSNVFCPSLRIVAPHFIGKGA